MYIPGPPSFRRRLFLRTFRWNIKFRYSVYDIPKSVRDFTFARWKQLAVACLLLILGSATAYLFQIIGFGLIWELGSRAALVTIRSTFSTSIPAIVRDVIVPLYILLRLYGREILKMLKTKRRSAGRYAIEGGLLFFIPFFAYNLKLAIDDFKRKSEKYDPSIVASMEQHLKHPLPSAWERRETQPRMRPSQQKIPILPPGWRGLSDWQKVTLRARLSRFKKQKVFIFAENTEETLHYGRELRDFLGSQEIGWTTEGPRVAPKDQALMDVQLSVSDKYFAKPETSTIATTASAFKDDLRFVGINAQRLVFDPDVYADEIAILVGPPSPHGESAIILPLEVRCRNPVVFSDTIIQPPINAKFARALTVRPSEDGKKFFKEGDTVRVFFNLPITGYYSKPERLTVSVAQRVMVRNDAMDVTTKQPIAIDDSISLIFVSDREFKIRCVDFWLKDRDKSPGESK